MKLEYITKSEFDFLKDNLVEWFHSKLEKDPDTIFQFSSDLTSEDKRYIYQNADNFIIDKNTVMDIDNFEKVNVKMNKKETRNGNKGEEDHDEDEDDVKYEIIMRAGRKYYNKLQRYPQYNLGTINIMNTKLDFVTKITTCLFIMNLYLGFHILNNKMR